MRSVKEVLKSLWENLITILFRMILLGSFFIIIYCLVMVVYSFIKKQPIYYPLVYGLIAYILCRVNKEVQP